MKIWKQLFYTIGAPWARRLFYNTLTSKKIKGSGLELYYYKGQHLGFLFSKEIDYEPAFSRILLDQIKPGSLVFEIGSNIGQYSLQISEKLGPQGRLICVEPDSDNYAMLSHNITANKCNNVTLVHKAVSDREGTMTMYKDTTTGGRMSSLFREYSGMKAHGKTEEVEVTTLRHLIETYGIPSFVKVDVEGAEQLVFSDEGSITPQTRYLVEVRTETSRPLFNLFQNQGFHAFLLEQDKRQVNDHTDIPGFANLLFVHT